MINRVGLAEYGIEIKTKYTQPIVRSIILPGNTDNAYSAALYDVINNDFKCYVYGQGYAFWHTTSDNYYFILFDNKGLIPVGVHYTDFSDVSAPLEGIRGILNAVKSSLANVGGESVNIGKYVIIVACIIGAAVITQRFIR